MSEHTVTTRDPHAEIAECIRTLGGDRAEACQRADDHLLDAQQRRIHARMHQLQWLIGEDDAEVCHAW